MAYIYELAANRGGSEANEQMIHLCLSINPL